MRNVAPSPDDLDLDFISRVEALGGIADFRLLRFAAQRDDFTTGEAARAIGRESQSAVDRRAERLVDTMLTTVGTGKPKRFAATPQARTKVAAVQALVSRARVGRPPSRLICVRRNASVDPNVVTDTIAGAIEIYDADGAFSLVGVFDDEPQLVRDLLHRLHQIGAEADEIRIATKRL